MLSNIRHYIDSIIPKAIYHAIMESHLYYSSLVGAKSFIHLKKESFNKKLQLVHFTDSFFFCSCFHLEFFFLSIDSSALSSSLLFSSCLHFLELGSCLIGISPSSTPDTSANQQIFFLIIFLNRCSFTKKPLKLLTS